MNELFTFIGDKKTVYITTIVDHHTRCILGWLVAWERTQEAIRLMVDQARKAKFYFSDAFPLHGYIWYHYRRYQVSGGKNDTYC